MRNNPLLSTELLERSQTLITKCHYEGMNVIDELSKQDKYDLMMTILDKDCEERSDLEVRILVSIVSDIRFFRDIKSSM